MTLDKPTILSTMHTIKDMVRYGTSLLSKTELYYGHGYLNAYEEAIQACMHTLHLNYQDYDNFAAARVLDTEKAQILDLFIERCYTRKPLAYLIKKAPFHGLEFYIDERAIIPRSFIGELLVNDALLPFLKYEPNYILDMCTGSACLPIIAAHVFNEASIDAADISEEALEVAKINIEKFKLEKRIKLYQSDVYSNLPLNKKYDIIISNPPYVNANSMNNLPSEYKQEPQIALHGGKDGMDIVKKILKQAKQWSSPNGIILIEIGNEYENAIECFKKLKLTWLSTSAGEEQVFLIYAADLADNLSFS